MKSDDTLIPCVGKSDFIHVLKNLVVYDEGENNGETAPVYYSDTYLIIDWMSVVHDVLSAMSPIKCKELGEAFTRPYKSDARINYDGCRLIFDNYVRQNSITPEITRHKQGFHQQHLVSMLLIHLPLLTLRHSWPTMKQKTPSHST